MGGGDSRDRKDRGRFRRSRAGAASLSLGEPSDPGFAHNPWAPAPREPWVLATAATLRPGQKGTLGLLGRFGDRLVCVRYRTDRAARKRYKTAEIIVAEADWDPPPGPEDPVHVRVAWEEEDLRRLVKEAGGRWHPETRTWELALGKVRELGIEDSVVECRR